MKRLSLALIISTALTSCGDPNSQIKFEAAIDQQTDKKLILTTKVTNYSDSNKTLNEIDIDKALHEKLNLSKMDGSTGQFIPLDNTYSYEVNKIIPPGESLSTYFRGSTTNDYISGDIDFIINNTLFNFRSVSVDCCK
tara:strand:+ start:28 stop:441 length:414 start_codon:yes stop_codon:yes gene_type:complete